MTHKLNPSANGEWLVLVGPYNPALIDALKLAVPASGREWRQVAKVWRIALEHRDVVQGLIDEHSRAEVES